MPLRFLPAALAALGLFGFFHEQLYVQRMWAPEGPLRFAAYASVYWLVAGILLWRNRAAWLIPLGLLYVAWWAGPLAPAAALFFLGSCYALGRRFATGSLAVLIGVAFWTLALWCALHFPVNYAWTYLPAFAVPYFWKRPPLRLPAFQNRREAAAFALLLFVLGAQLLAALQPETSSDGLSMHLALPASVANLGYWPFDHLRDAWALMPAGADALYTGVYLLAGEAAAKLLNFAFLALTCALLVRLAWRWTGLENAYLCAALFASTPLLQLVTGSLFVENLWAALILAAVGVLLEEGDERIAGVLMGAAVSVKLIAAAFVAPLFLLLWFRGHRRVQMVAAAALFALPTYLFAYARSGNPIFPFANAVFQSPDFDSKTSFSDPRYAGLRPSLTLPYDITFRSATYIEGQGGAAGFQYFVLLLPALLLARRRDQQAVAATCLGGAGIVLLAAPNLRYLAPAFPLASLALAWLPVRVPVTLALLGLNLWFLPSAGYYNPGFALYRKSEVQPAIAEKAPVRLLIDRLNRTAPGEATAFFSTDATAGLRAAAYTDTWHHERYWEPIRNAPDAAAIAGQLRAREIRHVIAPSSRRAPFEVVQSFLTLWLDPEAEAGPLTLYRLREAAIPLDPHPLPPGQHDNTERRIEYSGAWLHDTQFAEPIAQTLSYSDTPGDSLKFEFEGAGVEYIYTRAANRGIAEVWIDGKLRRRIDAYAPRTAWRTTERFPLPPGEHTFELRVSGRKAPGSSGLYVDLDAVTVIAPTGP